MHARSMARPNTRLSRAALQSPGPANISCVGLTDCLLWYSSKFDELSNARPADVRSIVCDKIRGYQGMR
jgi:hypothetical protein